MRPAIFLLLGATLALSAAGCCHRGRQCDGCYDDYGYENGGDGGPMAADYPGGCPSSGAAYGGGDPSRYPGPPSAAVTYPYYTSRGPRDFLQNHPRGIGP